MSGGKKRKSAAKRKSTPKPAKYVVAPLTPVKTRSKGKKSKAFTDIPVAEVTTPTVVMPVDQEVTSLPSPPEPSTTGSSTIADLEKRFDDRMAKMETTFRSTISEMSLARLTILVGHLPLGQRLLLFQLSLPLGGVLQDCHYPHLLDHHLLVLLDRLVPVPILLTMSIGVVTDLAGVGHSRHRVARVAKGGASIVHQNI